MSIILAVFYRDVSTNITTTRNSTQKRMLFVVLIELSLIELLTSSQSVTISLLILRSVNVVIHSRREIENVHYVVVDQSTKTEKSMKNYFCNKPTKLSFV